MTLSAEEIHAPVAVDTIVTGAWVITLNRAREIYADGAIAISGGVIVEVGKRAGPWLLDHRPMRGNLGVKKTMQLLERYGGPAVFLGRFIAFARAIIPGLAGFSGLRYRTFFIYNAAGGILWGVGYTLLGYVVGLSFERILREVGLWSLAGIGGLIVIALVVQILLKRREKRKLTSEFGAEGDNASTPQSDTTS